MERIEYWYWFCNIASVGRGTQGKLLEYFNDVEEIYHASESDLKNVIEPSKIEAILASKKNENIGKQYCELQKRKIQFISCEHPLYPKKFFHLADYPYGFYLKGKMPDPNRISLAIVGSRQPTSYGVEMTHFFSKELAKKGIQIISGLAMGIDSLAHQGALKQQGYTMGILGSGINVCYPKENYPVYEMMSVQGGILSENPLNTKPYPGLFPRRNRLISALSDGVFVIEAKMKSGSLITVDQGLELGRQIFALPGRITDIFSGGCNHLIKFGAKPVNTISDILEEYGIEEEDGNFLWENKKPLLVNEEKIVYSVLSLEPKYIDIIIEETGLSVQSVLSTLFNLELKGLIKQSIKSYYTIVV